jgi:hypothetical protein
MKVIVKWREIRAVAGYISDAEFQGKDKLM